MTQDPLSGAAEDDTKPELGKLATRVTHLGRPPRKGLTFINPPIVRGSTVSFPTVKQRLEAWGKRYEQELVYGIVGTPTHFALEDVVADIEGGARCQITSSGLSACTLALMAFLKAGDHCLIPDSVYGPVRAFASHVLCRYGVSVTFYDPTCSLQELEAQARPGSTKVLYIESPGSHTFELVDVGACSDLAHRLGAKAVLDNTWGVHFFQPFTTGRVDVSIQALTKYVVGHSDALLGAIVVRDGDHDWKAVRDMALSIGDVASPDDCWLALRGVRTLSVRLEHQMRAGLEVARFFSRQPEVLRVLHPALPSHPAHALYRRDYTGACSLFGVVFQPRFAVESMFAMLESYTLLAIGASWGGYESLVLPTTQGITRSVGEDYRLRLGGPTARYHIGLEDVSDLIADLQAGLAVLREAQARREGQTRGGAGAETGV